MAPKDSSLNFRGSLFNYFWAIVLISAVISFLEDFCRLLPARTVTVKCNHFVCQCVRKCWLLIWSPLYWQYNNFIGNTVIILQFAYLESVKSRLVNFKGSSLSICHNSYLLLTIKTEYEKMSYSIENRRKCSNYFFNFWWVFQWFLPTILLTIQTLIAPKTGGNLKFIPTFWL